MTVTDIVSEIINGNFSSSDLNTIFDACRTASKLSRAKETAVAISTIKRGMTGTLKNIRPKSYVGIPIEVVEVRQSRVKVKKLGGSAFDFFTVPASCIELNT